MINLNYKTQLNLASILFACLISLNLYGQQDCGLSFDDATAECSDDGSGNYDLLVSFTHDDPISTAAVNIEVTNGMNQMALETDVATTGVPQMYTFPALANGDGTMGINVTVTDVNSPLFDVFISEFHYDNTSGDVGEFIEVTGPAGQDLTGWSLVLYNQNGSEYGTYFIGTLTNTTGCGTWDTGLLPTNSIQNGGNDGIALINADGDVVQFISYEGTTTAMEGPANGETSTDIGVSEPGSTPVGSSLTSVDGFIWNLSSGTNTRGVVNAGSFCPEPRVCEVSGSFDEPDCCTPPTVTAVAVCNDGTNDAGLGDYYVQVDITDLGSAPSVDVSAVPSDGGSAAFAIDGVPAGTYYFGPFTHTNQRTFLNGYVDLIVESSTDGNCSTSLIAVETFCGFDPTGDDDGIMDPLDDEDLHSSGFACNCGTDPDSPVTILIQSEPGTFYVDPNTGHSQIYVLVDEAGLVVDFNNSGYFGPGSPMFMDGIYEVYAFNLSLITYADINQFLLQGTPIQVALDIAEDLCATSCSVSLDIDCNCCMANAGGQNTDPVGLCAEPATDILADGSVAGVEITFSNLPFRPEPDRHGYAFVLTDDNGLILSIQGSLNYDIGTPDDFMEDVLLVDDLGNPLGLGEYCIHGLSYLLEELSLGDLQAFLGVPASTVAQTLFYNNGVITPAGMAETHSYCADLNVTGCTPVIVNPTPEITAHPENTISCAGDEVFFSARARVSGNAALTFSLQRFVIGQGWINYDSETFDAPTGLETAVFGVVTQADMNCNRWRVAVTADNEPDPNCISYSEEAISVVHNGGAMVCNDRVNIGLDGDCQSNFSVTSFIEGDKSRCGFLNPFEYLSLFYTVHLEAADGTLVYPGDNLRPYANQCLKYIVTDVCTGNTCWGEACLDDKEAPFFNICKCPIGGDIEDGEYSDDCSIKCSELDLIQNGIEDVVSCNYLPLPSFIDNCTNTFTLLSNLVHTDEVVGQQTCGTYYFRRHYRLMDTRLNEYTGELESYVADECIQEYEVTPYDGSDYYELIDIEDLDDATDEQIENSYFLPVSLIELSCNDDFSPEAIAERFDQPGSPAPSGDFPNTEVVENHEGYAYAYPFYFSKGAGCNYHPQKIDNNVCNLTVKYTDSVNPVCGDDCYGNSKTIREWLIVDWCDTELVYWTQIIKANDRNGPNFDVIDNYSVSVDPWTCTADFDLPVPSLIHDDCDGPTSYEVVAADPLVTITGDHINGFRAVGLNKTMPGQPSPFYYTAYDCCGNATGPVLVNITAVDATPPVPVTLEHLVVNLSSVGFDSAGIAAVYASSLDNGSYDLCGGVHLEIRRTDDNCGILGNSTYNNNGDTFDDIDDPDDGAYIHLCCDDLTEEDNGFEYGLVEVQIRVWDDGNMDGIFGNEGDNFNESWATIRVENKIPPPPICPPNIVFNCEWDFNNLDETGVPQVFVTCGSSDIEWVIDDNVRTVPARKSRTDASELNSIVGEVVQPYDPSCRTGALKRNFDGGCVQWIIVQPSGNIFDDSSIIFPEDDFFASCFDVIQEPTWDPHQCQLIGYSVVSDTFDINIGGCVRILNHFTVVNWCEFDQSDTDLNEESDPTDDGYIPGQWTHTQTITIQDNIDPSFEMLSDTCISVNENCLTDAQTLSFVGQDDGDCSGPWIEWEIVLDLWGDLTPDYTYSSYLHTNDPFYIRPTARGEQMDIVLPDGLGSSKADHKLFISVSDGCDNITSSIQIFKIVDKIAPTPYCLNLSTAVMSNGQVELWACDFDNGSFDNCTGLEDMRFTFSDVVPSEDPDFDEEIGCSARIFDRVAIDSAGTDEMITIPVYVWDECDNSDFCMVNLRLIDNNSSNRADIGGFIATEEGKRVDAVELELITNAPEFPSYVFSDQSGEYMFADNPMYHDYTMQAEKDLDHLNGVSTLDLVLIQRHILGIKPLISAFKLIAADVNNDESVSSIDLIELRKLILGIYTELPANDSWRFVNEKFAPHVDSPWPFVEQLDIIQLEQHMMDENYVGVKVGDVNGSVVLNLEGESTDSRSSESLSFATNTEELIEGEVIIHFSSKDFEEISGFQFTMLTKGLELIDFIPGVLNMGRENFAAFSESITSSWHSDQLRSLSEDETLFSLKFKQLGVQAFDLSNLVVVDMITRSEAYKGTAYEVLGIDLEVEDRFTGYELLQNEPNPFVDYTMIGFVLPEKSDASLIIYDSAGKVLKVIRDKYKKGLNQIRISKTDLNSYGLLYYQLDSGDFNDTKKMVLIK